ncbi:MAG: hypothetical protein L3J47_09300 [Sulfurovum sp.]|nr:hypothetical protein [Sulfurovum sp.]
MSHIVVFLHVLSAFVWIGGMIAIRIAVHPVISRGGVTPKQMLESEEVANILEPQQRLGITLQIVGRLFNLVIPFILTLLITGLTMAIATQGHHGTLKSLFITKEIIWTVMTLNFTYMFFQRRTAWKLFSHGKIAEAKAKVALIPNLLLPINIVLGIVALWLGVSLRGM